MKVVRFLERENVIKLFGLGLVLAPFFNIILHLWIQKIQYKVAWAQINIVAHLKSGNPISYILAFCSIAIGIKMLGGTTRAWRYVLALIGAHLIIQVLNLNNKAWLGPLAWPSFILNVGLFYFIIDQLVWKIDVNMFHAMPKIKTPIKAVEKPVENVTVLEKERQVINLKSYRKILFSFGSKEPWGELKTLSSEELAVRSFAKVPDNIEGQIVQINFSKDVIVEIQFSRRENEMYYFKPLNMEKENIVRLNQWLKKIAV